MTATALARPVRIAIVAHFAHRALSGSSVGHIGGVERQTTLLARWLASRGHHVTLIVWDEGQPGGETIDGVQVLKLCGQHDGVPLLRFVYPRWTSLVRALKLADADVYYQNCGEYVTGQVAMWCRLHRRAFVYSAAADADCERQLPLMREWRVRALYRIGLRLAHRIVVQTPAQQLNMREGFRREATIIPLPSPTLPDAAHAISEGISSKLLLWVGRICRAKRPDRFIEVARRCPHFECAMVGPHDEDADYAREIENAAAGLSNLALIGPLDRVRLDELYGRALALCCTSEHEGFPNTFLEAWNHGVPLLSTWDPGGLIRKHDLGVIVADVEQLSDAAVRLASDVQFGRSLTVRAKAYFTEHHSLDRVMPHFERVFLDSVAQWRAVSPPVSQGIPSR